MYFHLQTYKCKERIAGPFTGKNLHRFGSAFKLLKSRPNYNYAGGLTSKLSMINRWGFVISVSI